MFRAVTCHLKLTILTIVKHSAGGRRKAACWRRRGTAFAFSYLHLFLCISNFGHTALRPIAGLVGGDGRAGVAEPADGTVAWHMCLLALEALPKSVRHNKPLIVMSLQGRWVVTGGLGSLGLLTARWLAGQGRRHITLLGRSGRWGDVTSMRLAGSTVCCFPGHATIDCLQRVPPEGTC